MVVKTPPFCCHSTIHTPTAESRLISLIAFPHCTGRTKDEGAWSWGVCAMAGNGAGPNIETSHVLLSIPIPGVVHRSSSGCFKFPPFPPPCTQASEGVAVACMGVPFRGHSNHLLEHQGRMCLIQISAGKPTIPAGGKNVKLRKCQQLRVTAFVYLKDTVSPPFQNI